MRGNKKAWGEPLWVPWSAPNSIIIATPKRMAKGSRGQKPSWLNKMYFK